MMPPAGGKDASRALTALNSWYRRESARGGLLDEKPVRRRLADGVLALFEEFGLGRALARPATVESLARRGGIIAGGRPSLEWMLRFLRAEGRVEKSGGRWILIPQAPPRPRAALGGPAAVTWRWLKAYLARYPAFWRGHMSGERAVLVEEASRWKESFRARALGGLDSDLLGRALKILQPGRKLLELGCGTGGGTRAVLAALKSTRAGRSAKLVVSDVRRGYVEDCLGLCRRTIPGLRAEGRVLDLGRGWAGQGLRTGEFDAVLCGNVLHAVPDLSAVLREARRVLRPSGWLLAAEHRRKIAREPELVELPLMMLRGYFEVSRTPWQRLEFGFRAAAQWAAALRDAGFEAVLLPEDPQASAVLIAARKARRAPDSG